MGTTSHDFWNHLEAMSNILRDKSPQSISMDCLQRELREMSSDELKLTAQRLNTVAAGISKLATMDSQHFDPASHTAHS
jgi:hypothetical protein